MEVRAHVFPVGSNPRVGSTVKRAPTVVRIQYDGEVERAFSIISVFTSDGIQVDKKNTHVSPEDRTVLEVNLLPLQPGMYTVRWTALATDGHVTQGSYHFTVKQ
ncbi:MAG: copper resistance protein CopC [Nitrospinota bacterium]